MFRKETKHDNILQNEVKKSKQPKHILIDPNSHINYSNHLKNISMAKTQKAIELNKTRWINNILVEEDKKAQPGTAASNAGSSKLSQKYGQMNKVTMEQKANQKYFNLMSKKSKTGSKAKQRFGRSMAESTEYPYSSS